MAEQLAAIEGRELSPAEVAEKQEVAALLCGVDDQVLTDLWRGMTRTQLEFQDWVFGQVCRERSEVYAAATGRFSSGDTPATSTGDPTVTSNGGSSTTVAATGVGGPVTSQP